MTNRIIVLASITITMFAIGYACIGSYAKETHVYEIRTYTAEEGKLDALHERFRKHTDRLFKKHGIISVGYWTPKEGALSKNTLIYILKHPSMEEAKKNWEAFRSDPEWLKVKKESQANGSLVSKVESIFLDATDYSAMR
jgi:hypothetical protein